MIWPRSVVLMPRIFLRVVWGLSETMATLACIRALRNVDLPTLVRPSRATYPERRASLFFMIDAHGLDAVLLHFLHFENVALDRYLVLDGGDLPQHAADQPGHRLVILVVGD